MICIKIMYLDKGKHMLMQGVNARMNTLGLECDWISQTTFGSGQARTVIGSQPGVNAIRAA